MRSPQLAERDNCPMHALRRLYARRVSSQVTAAAAGTCMQRALNPLISAILFHRIFCTAVTSPLSDVHSAVSTTRARWLLRSRRASRGARVDFVRQLHLLLRCEVALEERGSKPESMPPEWFTRRDAADGRLHDDVNFRE